MLLFILLSESENGLCQKKPKCRLNLVGMCIREVCMVKRGQSQKNMDDECDNTEVSN